MKTIFPRHPAANNSLPPLPATTLTAIIRLLVRETGMVSLAGREGEVAAAAILHAQERGFTHWADYAEGLADRQLLLEIAERLTIGETYFFRHAEVFAALHSAVFPEMARLGQPVHFWSAACSIGCEPYSLAIAWKEFGSQFGGLLPSCEILGTDLNTSYLRNAEEAAFGEWSFRNLTPEWITSHFSPLPDGRYLLNPAYRRMVRFRPFNLQAEADWTSVPEQSFDLIFCRNVMIYFDPGELGMLAERFWRALRPGGWLVVGSSECTPDFSNRFQVRNFPGAVLYQKATEPALTPELKISTPAPPPSPGAKKIPATSRTSPTTAKPRQEPSSAAAKEDLWALALGGKWDTLRTEATQALLLRETDAEAHFLQAVALQALEDFSAAEAAYRRALFLNRSHAGAQLNLALLLADSPERRPAAARALTTARKVLQELASGRSQATGAGPGEIFLCPQGMVSLIDAQAALDRAADQLGQTP